MHTFYVKPDNAPKFCIICKIYRRYAKLVNINFLVGKPKKYIVFD